MKTCKRITTSTDSFAKKYNSQKEFLDKLGVQKSQNISYKEIGIASIVSVPVTELVNCPWCSTTLINVERVRLRCIACHGYILPLTEMYTLLQLKAYRAKLKLKDPWIRIPSPVPFYFYYLKTDTLFRTLTGSMDHEKW